MNFLLKRWGALAASGAMAVVMLAGCGGHDDNGSSSASAVAPQIMLVSSDVTRVSGTTTLVDVQVPDTSVPITATLNGGNVSAAFKPDPARVGHLLGVVSGVVPGPNTLNVTQNSAISGITFTGYPITGPIISGPHQTPFICETSTFLLPDNTPFGPALDADCSAAPKVTYMYLQTNGTALVPMPSTTTRPADVASTTTLAGTTVPFIVRVETTTVNRGINQTAVLHDPTVETTPTPTNQPKAWNKRLIAIEGFGCPGGWYIQGAVQGSLAVYGMDFTLLSVARLGEGYATFANTLNHASNDCNAVLESETLMMSKEAFIKTYGAPAITVSAGCSGGSYGSSQPADRIPGLFDGVLVACTFPDPLAIAFSGSDGHLLSHYWAVTNPTGFTDAQKNAVTGYKSVQAFLDAANQAGRTDPVPNRVDVVGYSSATWDPSVPIGLRYDPVTNKTGARPTVYDADKNMYGTDKTTGFALRPFDNVGVQYGLNALNSGAITTTQFLDLNQAVGGYDQDDNYVANRVVGDPGAITRAQQSGLQEYGGGGLANIPVFDMSGIYNDDGGYHYQWFHFAMRARMLQANGDTKNHVMWRGNVVPFANAWSTFINWVVAYKADTGTGSQRDKVIRDKPAAAVDGCWSNPTTFITETQTLSNTPNTPCNTLFPAWTFPRYQAGGPIAANIMKCTLKPITTTDYTVTFTTAELARLSAIFPSGVCDFTKPGVNQTALVPNGSFGPSPINLVFDITKQ